MLKLQFYWTAYASPKTAIIAKPFSCGLVGKHRENCKPNCVKNQIDTWNCSIHLLERKCCTLDQWMFQAKLYEHGDKWISKRCIQNSTLLHTFERSAAFIGLIRSRKRQNVQDQGHIMFSSLTINKLLGSLWGIKVRQNTSSKGSWCSCVACTQVWLLCSQTNYTEVEN